MGVQAVGAKRPADPIKAQVHTSRTKQLILMFFDAKGIIYTKYAPRGETINAVYFKTA
jgi:hypothetical protein